VIIVDDGSAIPVADSVGRLGFQPAQIIRQANQGLLLARLTGLQHATGTQVLFLDSDDIVGPDKFRLQLAAMHATQAETSYSDTAQTILAGEYDSLTIRADAPLRDTTQAADFFIEIQPAPHSPIFRTDYVRQIVDHAIFPPSPLYNAVAEVWLYQNAAPRPGRVVRVPGAHTIIGNHAGARLTNHWERLAVASLAVMEAFARTCPADTAEARRARELMGKIAFLSWRKLPPDFSPEFQIRQLSLFHRLLPLPELATLGGYRWRWLAVILGPVRAARLGKLIQAGSYEKSRTMDDVSFQQLLRSIPSP
jgi:glycosyltransferase involved in cell wall biosynthesis